MYVWRLIFESSISTVVLLSLRGKVVCLSHHEPIGGLKRRQNMNDSLRREFHWLYMAGAVIKAVKACSSWASKNMCYEQKRPLQVFAPLTVLEFKNHESLGSTSTHSVSKPVNHHDHAPVFESKKSGSGFKDNCHARFKRVLPSLCYPTLHYKVLCNWRWAPISLQMHENGMLTYQIQSPDYNDTRSPSGRKSGMFWQNNWNMPTPLCCETPYRLGYLCPHFDLCV